MGLERQGEELANRIATTFENKSYELDFIHRRHFMVRRYRTTKNKMFLNPIIEGFLIEMDEIVKDFETVDNKYIRIRSEKLFNELKKEHGIKIRKRVKLFKKRKKYLFYYHIIQNMYFWREFGINKGKLKSPFSKGLVSLKRFLKSGDFGDFFYDEDMIKYFGTQLVNCVYYLKFMNLVDITKEFTKRFKEIFNDKMDKEISDYLYVNKVYGMTHFIIADTNYYQKYASPKEFDWILSYFKKNMQMIINRTNPDVVSEVGLCFKLCRQNPKELDMIRKYLISHFDNKLGYIPRTCSGMPHSEHTGAVTYLFLSNFKKLYSGPDISKQINELI